MYSSHKRLFLVLIGIYFGLGLKGYNASQINNSWYTELYTYVGDNVTLNCNIISNVSEGSIRWFRQEDRKTILSGGNLVDDRYHLKKDHKNGIFYLCIFGFNETDGGTYICDMQAVSSLSFVNQTTRLVLVEATSINPYLDKEISTRIFSDYTQTFTKEKNKLEETTADVRNKDDNIVDNGSFFRDNFYIVSLGAGLVIVLLLSIGCNVLINKNCKSRKIIIEGRPEHENKNRVEANVNDNEDDIFSENGDDSEQYELIDENKMTHYVYPSENEIETFVATRGDHRSREYDTTVEPYLTVVEDNSSEGSSCDELIKTLQNHQHNETDNKNELHICEVHHKKPQNDALSLSDKDDKINESNPHSPCGAENNFSAPMEGREKHSDKSFDIRRKNDIYLNPCNPLLIKDMDNLQSYSVPSSIEDKVRKRDFYLNPYNPLQTNDMEYLHSYSVPSSVEDKVGKRDSYLNSYNQLQTNDMEYLHSYSVPSSVEDKVRKRDSYLNPYNPLQTNDMEYLHSYSVPTKTSPLNDKEEMKRDSYLKPNNPLLSNDMGFLKGYSSLKRSNSNENKAINVETDS